MSVDTPLIPSWTHWEKRKHRALVALAILVSAGMAAAASNERRMFLVPDELPLAMTAIAAPVPTLRRSPIMGYLNDGCEPDLDTASGSISRAVEEDDCGKHRKRSTEPAAAPEPPPSAFFAMPDEPIALTDTPLPVIAELAPGPQMIPVIGRNPFTTPVRAASGTPPVLLTGVPEPAAWALMIAGFAATGGVLRRRRERLTQPLA